MKDIKACLSHQSDEWSTPKDIYEVVCKHQCFDPCKLGQKEDGLSMEWCDYNYVNPPFSKLSEFVDKSIVEWAKNGKKTIILMPVRTDTKYFKALFESNTDFVFICGRLKFGESNKSAPFPTMITFIGFSSIKNKMQYIDKANVSVFLDCVLYNERFLDRKRKWQAYLSL